MTGISTVVLSDDDQTMNTHNIHFGSFDEVQIAEKAPNSNKDKGKAPMADELVHNNFKRSPHAKVVTHIIQISCTLKYIQST